MKAKKIRCVITAGPTREHLDPVRFFSNGSSGRMGYALAVAALERGWEVVLISGPVSLDPPDGARLVKIVSADDLLAAAEAEFDSCDVIIFCAAVADFRPASRETAKGQKHTGPFSLEMIPNPDVARTLGGRKRAQLTVGFAAETDDLEAKASRKRVNKHLDWIVGNLVGGGRPSMEGGENTILLLGKKGERWEFGPAPKADVADFILGKIAPVLENHG